jgi:hypothetical protein
MHKDGGHRRLWIYQDDKLREMFDRDFSIKLMASELSRTEKAVWMRLINLGAIKRKLKHHILGFYGDSAVEFSDVGGESVPTSVYAIRDELGGVSISGLVDKLHPAVRKFVLALIDGRDITDAAAVAGLSKRQLDIVLPPLRSFLRPHLGGC